MKKLLRTFSMLAIVLLSSCSDGGGGRKSFLKASIAGVPHVFSTFSVEK